MRSIYDPRITKEDGKFIVTCACGKVSAFAFKSSARAMLRNGYCRMCSRKYQPTKGVPSGVYRRQDGRWCCVCSGCNSEQAYTRKDHAIQSLTADWQCKPCAAARKKYSANHPVGDHARTYNRFRKAARSRGILWQLTPQEMYACFDGRCALTGWPISLEYGNQSASLDRVDSTVGYVRGNIQWVHTMVNMCKNKYDVVRFVDMCRAVAAKARDTS